MLFKKHLVTLLNRYIAYVNICFGIVVLCLTASSCFDKGYETYADALPDKIDYNYHIKPILSDRCYACHGPDKNAVKANLRLDIPESALKKTLR